MSLNFLHVGTALLGLAAASVPIVIHLLLRQRPKPIVFPALELIRHRRTVTVRRLKLRHLLLLAARIGLLLFLALALARPTLRSDLFAIDQEAPVAAVLVFDNSLSMQYKHRGQTRLEHAVALARGVLEKLPEQSEVSVIESSSPTSGLTLDVAGAYPRLESLELQAARRPLNESIEAALKGLAQSERDRREVYVFTDLAAHAWDLADGGRLRQVADLVPGGVRIYVINVGVEANENIALGDARLAQQVVSANEEFELETAIANSGPARDVTVELAIDQQARDAKAVHLPGGQATNVRFSAPLLTEGLHQGHVIVGAGDPMPFDDQRFFTFRVHPPVRTLLVADDPADTIHWSNALEPLELRAAQRPRYLIEVADAKELPQRDLRPFAVVSLINAGRVPPEGWAKLVDFVQGGGGLFVALGERIDPAAYAVDAARNLLPAVPKQLVRADAENFLAPDRFLHPILAKFRDWGRSDLGEFPVYRYWKVEVDAKASATIAPFTTGDAGLLERSFGEGRRGRSLLLATAVHYDPQRELWTELPARAWSYVVLADQITRYLAGLSELRLNYPVGAHVTIDLDPTQPFALFSVTDPQNQAQRLAPDQRRSTLTIPAVRLAGHWRIDADEGDRVFASGFSVNVPAEESALLPLPAEQLAELLGEKRVAVATDPEQLDEVVGEGRVGKELFGWLMLLVIALVCVEGYFANRFYK